jgi:diacylglycerol kinase family enzyme
LQAVVAAGGDGTVSVVAVRTPNDVPIAILPLGTENLVAKYLQLTCNPAELALAIAQGTTKQIDCGLANGKIFLVMVGIGFDAQVVLEMTRQRKGHIHHWSYAMPIWKSILAYRFPKLKITCQEQSDAPKTWTARWVFVANLPRYAAGLPIASWAESDDGRLDVCTFKRGGLFRSLYYFAFLFLNRHRMLNAFRTCKATHIRIEVDGGVETPVAYQLDGDHGGELPVEIEVIPNRIKLIVSA